MTITVRRNDSPTKVKLPDALDVHIEHPVEVITNTFDYIVPVNLNFSFANIDSAGDTILIPAQGLDKRIIIWLLAMSSDLAQRIYLKSGETPISAYHWLPANGSLILSPVARLPWGRTQPNEPLVINCEKNSGIGINLKWTTD